MNRIKTNENGRYIWEYELDLKNNRNILKLVMKILTIIFIFIILAILSLAVFNHSFSRDALFFFLKICIPIFLFVYLIAYLAYLLYVRSLNGFYHARFEMDENGIKHIPLEKEKEYMKNVGDVSIMIGALTRNLGAAGTGMYMSTMEEIYTDFSKVTGIVADPEHDLINVNILALNNQIYAEKEDYDFVLNYIKDHCPKAKVSYK